MHGYIYGSANFKEMCNLRWTISILTFTFMLVKQVTLQVEIQIKVYFSGIYYFKLYFLV